MVSVTDEQWARYEERYGKLMHTISMKISGDEAIATHEDNYADLCVAAIESISAFERKTGEDFEKAMNNKLFDQYTKTVLWNRKAKKGVPITKRMEFRNSQQSIDFQYDDETRACDMIPDTRSMASTSSVELEEFTESQTDDVKKVIDAILQNPNNVKVDGLFSYASIKDHTGLSSYNTVKAIRTLRDKLRKSYEV